MKKTLEMAVNEIGQYREEIVKKLLEFARTDLLFFWSDKKELYLKQESEWQPIIDWVGDVLKVEVRKTSSLDTPDNEEIQKPLKEEFFNMSDKELACYYAAALNMKSVLLALALVKGKIDAQTAGRLSYLEEIWQNEIWGSDEEGLKRRQERCDELFVIESCLRK